MVIKRYRYGIIAVFVLSGSLVYAPPILRPLALSINGGSVSTDGAIVLERNVSWGGSEFYQPLTDADRADRENDIREVREALLYCKSPQSSTPLQNALFSHPEKVPSMIVDARRVGILKKVLIANYGLGSLMSRALDRTDCDGRQLIFPSQHSQRTIVALQFILAAAREEGVLKAVLTLRNQSDKRNALMLAVETSDAPDFYVPLLLDAAHEAGMLQELLEAYDCNGDSVLSKAARLGDSNVVAHILVYGDGTDAGRMALHRHKALKAVQKGCDSKSDIERMINESIARGPSLSVWQRLQRYFQ